MTSLASGHKVHYLEGEEFDRIKEKCPAYECLVRLSPGGWLLPGQYPKFADKFFNFEVKASDVYLITYPKVGTTWTQEILWTMKFNPDLDNPEASVPINDRAPMIDADIFNPEEFTPEMIQTMEPFLKSFRKSCPGADINQGIFLQLGLAIKEPRILKSHLPLSLMPPTLLDKAKVVYVARNPKDVICSYYHHCRLYTEMKFTGTLDEFCEFFLREDLIYSPYWLHVKEAWEKHQHPSMHIMLYEDMKADIMKELKKLNNFLGTQLTDKQLENVANYTSFDEMKKRDNVVDAEMNENPLFVDQEVLKNDGGFFRKGNTGDGKKKISPELLEKMDAWITKFFDFGLKF